MRYLPPGVLSRGPPSGRVDPRRRSGRVFDVDGMSEVMRRLNREILHRQRLCSATGFRSGQPANRTARRGKSRGGSGVSLRRRGNLRRARPLGTVADDRAVPVVVGNSTFPWSSPLFSLPGPVVTTCGRWVATRPSRPNEPSRAASSPRPPPPADSRPVLPESTEIPVTRSRLASNGG